MALGPYVKQQIGGLLTPFFRKVKPRSIDCDFRVVCAALYKNAIGDVFIASIASNDTKQRLLKNEN